jgi:hypothetical protein
MLIFSSHNNLWVTDLEKVKCIVKLHVLRVVRISVGPELTPTLLSCVPDDCYPVSGI